MKRASRNGHDHRGRFTAGNPGGPGNPHGGKIEQFRATLIEVGQERFHEVANKLFDLAAAGEQWAIETILDRLLGKPVDEIELRTEFRTEQPAAFQYGARIQ